MLNLQLMLAFLFVSVLGSALGNRAVAPSTPETRPVTFVGNVAAIQATALGGDTRLYYQNPDNSIQETAISGPFAVGTSVFEGSNLLIPANEILPGTPIAAVTFNGNAFQQIHVFFVSPDNILSEYAWTGTVWKGGPSCSDCVTANRFAVQPGSKMLYAMGMTPPWATAAASIFAWASSVRARPAR
ncbi:hypothetical protein B0H14DRAFT_700280 [Mycena olivaceomarginata]|nr:hypothetical protein B0H14DRAFT_700280 [Mycena olivaceomarginata]